jgi:hypothetical protein
MGLIKGREKTNYYKGYADGQTDTHKFYREELLPRIKKLASK